MSKSNFGYPFKREDPGRPRPSCCQYRPQPRTEGLYHLAGIIALLSRAIALLPPSPVLSMCPVVEIPDDDDDDDPFYDDDDDHSVDLRSSRICTTSSSSSVSKATKYFVVVKSSAHSTHDPTTSMLDPNGGLEDSEDHQNGSRNAALSEDDNRIMQLLARLLDWNISEGRRVNISSPHPSNARGTMLDPTASREHLTLTLQVRKVLLPAVLPHKPLGLPAGQASAEAP